MTTYLYSNPICLEHLTPPGHPERPDRMRALQALFEHENFDPLVICDRRIRFRINFSD